MEILGVPPRELIEKASRRKVFFDNAGNPRIVANSRGKKRLPGTKSLSAALKCSDRGFVDLIRRCLAWDTKERLQPDECLNHPWIVNAMLPSAGLRGARGDGQRVGSSSNQNQQSHQQRYREGGGGAHRSRRTS